VKVTGGVYIGERVRAISPRVLGKSGQSGIDSSEKIGLVPTGVGSTRNAGINQFVVAEAVAGVDVPLRRPLR